MVGGIGTGYIWGVVGGIVIPIDINITRLNGQVTIPESVREALNISAGDKIYFEDFDRKNEKLTAKMLPKKGIVEKLAELVRQSFVINPRKDLMHKALEVFRVSNLAHIDCWLFVVYKEKGLELKSFNKNLSGKKEWLYNWDHGKSFI